MPRAAATAAPAAHPPFAEIITVRAVSPRGKQVLVASRQPDSHLVKQQEAIVTSKERSGISRSFLKNYIETNYKLDITPTVLSYINRALTSGVDKGIFVFPKGPSLLLCALRFVAGSTTMLTTRRNPPLRPCRQSQARPQSPQGRDRSSFQTCC